MLRKQTGSATAGVGKGVDGCLKSLKRDEPTGGVRINEKMMTLKDQVLNLRVGGEERKAGMHD